MSAHTEEPVAATADAHEQPKKKVHVEPKHGVCHLEVRLMHFNCFSLQLLMDI